MSADQRADLGTQADSISAVIPVHNRFEYLSECLASVFGQTRVPDEVLMVDDCSSHPIDEYLAGTPFLNRVTVLRTDRKRRVSGARNWGWKHARGSLIVFIDSDDVWEPFKTELQVRRLREHPEAAGTYGGMTAFFPDGRTQPWAHDRPSQVTVASALADCNISVQTLMIKRQALESIGGFDENFGILDDQEIAIRLAQHGQTILFFADPPLTRLRRNSQNYSANARRYFEEDLAINRRYAALMDEIYGPGSHRVHLARAITRFGRRVKYMGAPSRVMARLLVRSAPRSRMPPMGQASAFAG
jgi:glycosyltransferase involved in cell wall biosynthesis